MSVATYPVHVEATLEPRLSRWLWLVKWLLAIPHYFVLLFLWIGFFAVSLIAFVSILFTGRYPAGLFEFNVGVLRWTWRVGYYTWGALGTDRYPPFTLADVPDYPAHLDVELPTHLSRGLVLVKWWLLAIPHYLVVGIFLGGGTWALRETSDRNTGGPGLVGLLVLVAAIVLAFTGRYPQQIFDFVLGMDRWALRVAAYAGLMTDRYPPFRLDMGGHEPTGTMTMEPPETTPDAPVQPPPPPRRGWTAGRVVSLVIGCVVGLLSIGVIGAGGVATWATNSQRDAAGYLTSDTRTFQTPSYAVVSDEIDFGGATDWITPGDVLGGVRVRARATDPATRIFVGVAPKSAVDSYLAGVDREVVTGWADGRAREQMGAGAVPGTPPADVPIWTAKASGTGVQTLTWRPTSGHWAIVVMNADRSPRVAVTADVGAKVPDLGWIAAALLGGGAFLLVTAVALVAAPVALASR